MKKIMDENAAMTGVLIHSFYLLLMNNNTAPAKRAGWVGIN